MLKAKPMVVSMRDLIPIIVEMLNNNQRVIFTVSGDSMRPFIINNRDQVVLERKNQMNLRVGDIILFKDMDMYLLHRIYRKEKDGYRTIGDACLQEDGLVFNSQILGVVNKIYRKGKEIDCKKGFWRVISLLWVKLLPFRRYLLYLYFLLSRIKQKLPQNTKEMEDCND